jgi:hypothetical protein
MSIAIARTIHVLEEIVKVLPVGTNLALLHCNRSLPLLRTYKLLILQLGEGVERPFLDDARR